MKYTNTIDIWAPRFKDMTVLIAPFKVQPGINRIIFTKTWQDKQLFMDGEKIKSYPMQDNGKIGCHAVPVNDFDKQETNQLNMEGL